MNKKYSFLDKYAPHGNSYFDLQRFAGDDHTDPPPDDNNPPPPEEFEDYNGFKVPKGAVDAINKRVAKETHNWKEKHRLTEEKLNTLSSQFEGMKLSTMTEKERQAHDEQKRKDEIESLKNKADDKDRKFKTYFLDTELFREISNYDVVNAKQVIALLKTEYKHEFAESEEAVKVLFNKGSDKLTVQEAVKNYLQDPLNSNLIKSSLKTGTGTKTSTTQKKNLRTTFKRSEVANIDSDEAKEYNEAMKAGLNPTLV